MVKLIDGGKDLTSKSKAQRLDDLNIVGGTHSQKQAGRIEEGGSYLNNALRTQHNETTVMVNGEEKDAASGGELGGEFRDGMVLAAMMLSTVSTPV